jgi:hypothetical protein
MPDAGASRKRQMWAMPVASHYNVRTASNQASRRILKLKPECGDVDCDARAANAARIRQRLSQFHGCQAVIVSRQRIIAPNDFRNRSKGPHSIDAIRDLRLPTSLAHSRNSSWPRNIRASAIFVIHGLQFCYRSRDL